MDTQDILPANPACKNSGRRALFGHAAGIVSAIGLVKGLTNPAHADDAITAMAVELADLAKEREVLYAPWYDAVRYIFPPVVQARIDEIESRRNDLLASISAAKSTSIIGHRAKALALLDQYCPGGPADVPDLENDEYLAWSLCRDLLAGVA